MHYTNFLVILFAMLSCLTSTSCQSISQEKAVAPVYTKGVLRPAWKKPADDNYLRLMAPINRLKKKAVATRSLSNEEILLLKEYQIRKFSGPLLGHQALTIQENALDPFTSLTPKTLKQGQKELILTIINPVLTADDTNGYRKMNALTIIQLALVDDKSLLPMVQRLKSDKRIAVHASALRAEEALRGLKPFSLQE